MRINDDRLIEELRRLDPVGPGELDRAAEGDAAARLLERVVAADPVAEAAAARGEDRVPLAARARRPARVPKLALAGGLAALGALALVAVLLVSSGGGGAAGDPNRLAGTLDRAAAVAAVQPQAGVGRPWSYLKTRELAVEARRSDQRAWHVSQETTREEWMTPNGPGRMRIVAGPTRFVGSSDRAEWEGAGRPSFLTLGFGPRTEVHWIAGTVMRARVADLPTEPVPLADRLRKEAEAEHAGLALPAATLQLIAEDLRSPVATPALRRGLFEAAKRVPGIRYLGARTDPEGRRGIAVGVGEGAGGAARFALIFDPGTAMPLATEATARAAGGGEAAGPTISRATVYLEAPEDTPYLVYRIPPEGTSL
ncbi:MAG TPA: CU044_5270 family protein [Solirubrobacterales bacterium]|nr:CU044_5270 family protein [Solirubrobacterales bacterium]